jgi:hypothetical protein
VLSETPDARLIVRHHCVLEVKVDRAVSSDVFVVVGIIGEGTFSGARGGDAFLDKCIRAAEHRALYVRS